MKTQKDMDAMEVCEVIADCGGNLSIVARQLGCSRPTLYKYIKNHSTCQIVLDGVRETAIDNVESVLYSKALDGEPWAVMFFLRMIAKHRGYVERTEQRISGEDGGPIKIEPYDYFSAIAAITSGPGDYSQKEMKQ